MAGFSLRTVLRPFWFRLPGLAREIWVEFPYAGMRRILIPRVISRSISPRNNTRSLKTSKDKTRNNIYIPSYEEKNVSGARFEFPASKLSRDKKKAGVVKIPFPGPQKEGSESAP